MNPENSTNPKTPSWDRRRIRALRKKMGLSQREMAGVLGTRQQTISEWELGLYEPRGTSATLLSLVAEKAGFSYKASPPPGPAGEEEKEDISE